MSSFPFAAQTTLALGAYVKQPAQAILLSGNRGVGVEQVAAFLMGRLAKDAAHSLTVSPDGSSITIEQMRQLYALTRSAGKGRLMVHIDQADTMSQDAQNSFLKLLEEPPARVHFILTTYAPQTLLETIRSRVMHVEVANISDQQSTQLVADLAASDATRQQRALFLAMGLPAELKRLCTDDAYYEKRCEDIVQAKAWLGGDGYQRLRVLASYTKDRDTLQGFLAVLGALLAHSARSGISASTLATIAALEATLDRMELNVNVKLQALELAWSSSRKGAIL